MTREKLERIIEYSKNLELSLSVVFVEDGVQQEERIHFIYESFNDAYIDNVNNLNIYYRFNKRRIIINIAKIIYIKIYEKVIL